MSNVLKTDKYEFTMLEAFLDNGMADKKAVFELFGRKLPSGRDYGVVGGTGRAIAAIRDFRFTTEDLAALEGHLKPSTIEFLANYKFSGTINGYREGDFWFPYAPLITVESTLAEGVILETLLLSIMNYDSAVAAAASRMRRAAGDKFLMEFGARRVNEDAAVVASRAAYIAGFDATSNVEANKEYGVPVYGTSAHAFTLAFPTEKEAFAAQIAAFGTNTTLLVDTYDITEGVANAIEVAGPNLAGVRIDSGDPFVVIPAVRKQLDKLGAYNTKIVLSGDVDTALLEDLRDANIPVDSFGVGTRVVTGDGHVACGFVYKLVAVEQNGVMVPVAKKSAGAKKSVGGKKVSYRVTDPTTSEIVGEYHFTDGAGTMGEKVQVTYVENGEVVNLPTVEEARKLHALNAAIYTPGDVHVYVDGDQVW